MENSIYKSCLKELDKLFGEVKMTGVGVKMRPSCSPSSGGGEKTGLIKSSRDFSIRKKFLTVKVIKNTETQI